MYESLSDMGHNADNMANTSGGQYFDTNGDGVPDAMGIDTNGDGVVDTVYMDTNGDGQFDMVGHDSTGTGTFDVVGEYNASTGNMDTVKMDTDGDGFYDTQVHVDTATGQYDNESQIHEQDMAFNHDAAGSGLHSEYGQGDLLHEDTYSSHVTEENGSHAGTAQGDDINGDGVVSYMEVPTSSQHVEHGAYYNDQYGIMPPQYNADSGNSEVVGNPGEDMQDWHMQTHDDTCAVCSQEFVINDLLGTHVSEDQLVQIAEEHGWYTPGGGTSLENTGNLLEYYGLHVERGSGNINSMESALANGDKIVVGIDANEIWSNGSDAVNDKLDSVMGIPDTDANHAVEVIGVDNSDPSHPMVVLNDSGHPGGQGEMVPLELFEEAWSDSGNYMVVASN